MKPGVVVPTYEEAQTIPSVVVGLRDALPPEHEILVVDDSPTTATVDQVRERWPDDPTVRAWHRQGDGLGSAVLDGFRRLDTDCYICIDGDMQHPPARVRNLVGRLELGADLAVASRHVDGGQVVGDWPTHRRLISRGADTLARVAVPDARQLDDPLSGFFAVDADLVDGVMDRLRPRGYKIALEILGRVPVKRVDEVPFTFRERAGGESNLGSEEYLKYVAHLARLSIPARRPQTQVVAADASEVRD